MIVDSHQHFWDLDEVRYDWIIPEYGPIYRNFEPADLRPDLAKAGVDRTIAVQAANSLAETDALLRRAHETDFVGGVVGWIDLENPDTAEETLRTTYRAEAALKGIRHLNHDEPDPDWLVKPEVLESLAILAAQDLVFEVVAVYPLHVHHVATIVQEVPGLQVVIDHLAKPPIASGDLTGWKAATAAAAATGCLAKVSGLNTAADWSSWDADDLLEPVEHALDVFGPERLMFGSDWPVAILAGDYQRVWEATLDVLDRLGLEEGEKTAVLGANAAKVYRLENS